jgi:Domain of unknown function (DUF1992)
LFDGGVTERKPAGMSWDSWREKLIRLAREEGAFENLPGAGKPFTDLGQGYDPDWWVKKLVSREKVSILPPALELLRKVEGEVGRIWTLSGESEVREKVRALNVEIARVNARAAEGPPTRLAPLDPDAIVAQWRAARSQGSRPPSRA